MAIATLPLLAMGLVFVHLILKPVTNAISRRFERQCDGDALRRTRNPNAYRSAMQRLARMNLADPDPHPLIEWYFYDHPAMSKRVALADSAPFCSPVASGPAQPQEDLVYNESEGRC